MILDTHVRQMSKRQRDAQNFSREGWICNRGIAVRRHDNTILDACFCPPSYYGQFCQYFSARLTVVTHFDDLTNTLSSTMKILAVLLLNDMVVAHHEFHFTYALNDLRKKHKFYFVHGRPHNLSTNANYQVRFELYRLHLDSKIEFLAVWLYPMGFNFLPSNRLARVLKYRGPINDPQHICLQNNPCHNNSTCYPLSNVKDRKAYWCDCGDQFNGKNCQYTDRSCFTTDSSINLLATL